MKTQTKRFLYAVILISFFTSIYFFKPLLIFLIPGVIFIPLNTISHKRSFFEAFVQCITISVSFWITSFWILKIIPISFTSLIVISSLISFLIFLFVIYKHAIPENSDVYRFFSIKNISQILILVTFLKLYLSLYDIQLVPAGADMSAHTYMARIIFEQNKFPLSFEPYLPISGFGKAPFGLSVIIAEFSKLSDIPLHRTALLLTLLIYPYLALVLNQFLNFYFNDVSSFITVVFVLLGSSNIASYIAWGGNSTILSISLLIYAITYFTKVVKNNSLTSINCIVLATILYASFTVHFIPLISLLFALIPIFVFFIIKNKTSHPIYKFLINLMLVLFVFSLPFLFMQSRPSSETLEWVKSFQRDQIPYWSGSWMNFLITIPEYLVQRASLPVIVLPLIGIIYSVFTKNKHFLFYIALLIMFYLEIVNSKYWFLPLSYLLYPDRIATLIILLPFSIFTGLFFDQIYAKISDTFKNHKFNLMSVALLTFLVLLPLIYLIYKYYIRPTAKEVRDTSITFSMVTQDDINCMLWISNNTKATDVILNNYGDGGIWIPAIAGRRVVYNHNFPAYFDETEFAPPFPNPEYIFVGSKKVYPDSVNINNEDLKTKQYFKQVCSSGNSKTYKILKPNENRN